MRVLWTGQALEYLEELLEYIGRQSARKAELVAERIDAAATLLESQPRLGRPGLQAGTRELLVSRSALLLIYEIVPPQIQIVQVTRAARERRFRDAAD